jgi:hypothetical protein
VFAPPPDRVDVRVLQQQQRVVDVTADAPLVEARLEGEGRAVVDDTQPLDD